MPFRRLLLPIFLTILCYPAWASSLDINLRNSSLQAQFFSPLGHDSLGKTVFHVGYLYVDKTNSSNNSLVDFGIFAKDEVGGNAPGVSLGVGAKGLFAHTFGTNESAVALGAMAGFAPPAIPRMSLVGEFYFAPNITSFGDSNRYVESTARLEYEIVPNAAGYVGYRKIRFDLNKAPGDVTLDEGAFIGIRMSF